MPGIFSWFASWFTKREPFDLYQPRERRIYSFWNGKDIVHADPMVLYKRLAEKGPEMSVDYSVAMSVSKDADKCHGLFLNKIRAVFDISPPENPLDCSCTLSEVELENLLAHFVNYTEELKKNSKRSPTAATAASPLCASSSSASPATSNTSPSGSAANGCSSAAPAPSLTAPASPLVP